MGKSRFSEAQMTSILREIDKILIVREKQAVKTALNLGNKVKCGV